MEQLSSGTHIDFSKSEVLAQINGLFTGGNIQGMSEGREFQGIDMMFPLWCGFIDRATG